MASLSCGSCRTPVSPGDLICGNCQANLTSADAVVDTDEIEPESAAEDSAATCPSCDAALPATDSPACPACLTPLAGALILQLDVATQGCRPWRHVVLPGTSLVLGRDPQHSPAAAALEPYDTVSRRHARVSVGYDRQASVTDLESTNGTFVDGVRLRAGADVALPPGSRLRLGRSVSLLVERS